MGNQWAAPIWPDFMFGTGYYTVLGKINKTFAVFPCFDCRALNPALSYFLLNKGGCFYLVSDTYLR